MTGAEVLGLADGGLLESPVFWFAAEAEAAEAAEEEDEELEGGAVAVSVGGVNRALSVSAACDCSLLLASSSDRRQHRVSRGRVRGWGGE